MSKTQSFKISESLEKVRSELLKRAYRVIQNSVNNWKFDISCTHVDREIKKKDVHAWNDRMFDDRGWWNVKMFNVKNATHAWNDRRER